MQFSPNSESILVVIFRPTLPMIRSLTIWCPMSGRLLTWYSSSGLDGGDRERVRVPLLDNYKIILNPSAIE